MTHTHRVVKNSFWIIAQTLFLNLMSLFVIGYIARTLGNENFGIFNFAFTFVAIFMPFVNFGLGSLATREIAEHPESASFYMGRLLCLRICMSMIVYAAIIVAVISMGYSKTMFITISIAALNVIFNSFTATCNSAFQGIERMGRMAFIQFTSGLVLTILSVSILLFGFRLYALTVVYVFGSFLASIISIVYILKMIGIHGFHFDFDFAKKSIVSGFPLFLPGFISGLSAKFGIIVLEKIYGASSVGIYSAASGLIDKLMVIPDGICTAIFPTIATLYTVSRPESISLLRKFHAYLIIIGLPIAVGTTLIANPVIQLIYGNMYSGSVVPLQLLGWNLVIAFSTSIQGWTLGAIHQEKYVAKVSFVIAALSIPLYILLIHDYGLLGLITSIIIINLANWIFQRNALRRHLADPIFNRIMYVKIIVANIFMFISVFPLRSKLLLAVPLAVVIYILFLFVLKIISKGDIEKIRSIVFMSKVVPQ